MIHDSHLKEREAMVDWPLVIALLCLMVIGAMFIFSATAYNESLNQQPWFQQRFVKQIFSYGLGIGCAAAICFVDYHLIARWSLVIYWISIIALVLVLIPGIGVVRFGARRWIDFGLLQLQPSELAKLAFIIMQANYLSRPLEELRLFNTFTKSLAMTVLPFLLILKEPDLGSALVILPVGLLMMFAAGIPVVYLRRLIAGGAVVIGLLIVNILFAPPQWRVVEEYQRHRLLVYFNQDFAPPNATLEERVNARKLQRDKSYNVEQAMISVGSGGLTGKGWRQGTQNALGFLPRGVAHNDFIFSVIAEEKGFVGSVIVLGLYTVVFLSGIRIARQARDRLGQLLAVGVVTLLFSHVFINIGMNIRIMPVTGLPLPLLSYGGTSVLCSLIAVGILQNVYLYRRNY